MKAGGAIAGDQGGAMILAPGEEGGVVDQAIFDDLGIARAELALIQCVEQRRVGNDQGRHVEASDEILLPGGIDRGLAAHCAVGLGQQGGGDVDYRAAALEQACGEAGDIADRATAEGDDRSAAMDVAASEAVGDRGEGRPILGRLSFGDEDRRLDRHRGERGTVEGEDSGIGDQRKRLAVGEGANSIERVGQVADQHLISSVVPADGDGDH